MANRVSYISQNLAGLGKILGDCKRFTVIFQNSVTDQHDDRVKSRGATTKHKFKILLKWSAGVSILFRNSITFQNFIAVLGQ